MPPACKSYRMPDSRNAEPARDRHRIILRGPKAVPRDIMLEAKPLPTRGRVPSNVEARVIRQDLNPGADDKQHKERVQKVLCPQPERKTRGDRRGGGVPGIAADKF